MSYFISGAIIFETRRDFVRSDVMYRAFTQVYMRLQFAGTKMSVWNGG